MTDISKPPKWRCRFTLSLDGVARHDTDGLYVLASDAEEYTAGVLRAAIRLIHLATIRYPHGFTEAMQADARQWLEQQLL